MNFDIGRVGSGAITSLTPVCKETIPQKLGSPSLSRKHLGLTKSAAEAAHWPATCERQQPLPAVWSNANSTGHQSSRTVRR